MCLYSRLIKNPKYKANAKNGGIIPAVIDPRTLYVPIGCGQCIECRSQNQRQWQVRLQEEVKHNNKGAKFITLTLSNESYYELTNNTKNLKELENIQHLSGYDRDNEIATKCVRLFLERWRKKFKTTLRHWLITELGHNGTENIHLHGIVWTEQTFNDIRTTWNYGFIWPRPDEEKGNYVNMQTVNYIVKYVSKIDQKHPNYKSRTLTSPGIGNQYINSRNARNNTFNEENTDESYRTSTGHKIILPVYYRNKLYTDEQKEKLWIHKLNKQQRWICGEKIDMRDEKTGYKNYFGTLKYHRQRNKKLGYGRGEINLDKKEYEKMMREIQHYTRQYNYEKKLVKKKGWEEARQILKLQEAPF